MKVVSAYSPQKKPVKPSVPSNVVESSRARRAGSAGKQLTPCAGGRADRDASGSYLAVIRSSAGDRTLYYINKADTERPPAQGWEKFDRPAPQRAANN